MMFNIELQLDVEGMQWVASQPLDSLVLEPPRP